MAHKKLVAMTTSPTRYTKVIRNPGAGTKYNRTHQEVDFVSRYTKTVAGGKDYVPPAPPGPEVDDQDPITVLTPPEWDDKNVYRVGETIGCTTAIFEGGLPPFVTCNYRWQARKDGAVIETDKVEYGNEAITISGVIPKGCTEVRMWCQAADDLDGDPDVDSLTRMNAFSVIKTVEPIPTTIGILSITMDGTPVVWGEPIHVPVNTSVQAEVTITGDANPNYKWEARGNYPIVVGSQAASTTLTFPEEGGPTVTLTVTDSTATDSPLTYGMNFYVASQTEWDMLHPTTTN